MGGTVLFVEILTMRAFHFRYSSIARGKCQKFEKIRKKISACERSVDFGWGYDSRLRARFGFKFASRVVD